VCETTAGVRSFSGYISLPASSLTAINGSPGYNINTFFWFFESRKDPKNAPLAVYIQGGPGFGTASSVLNEAGPCTVNNDSNSTSLQAWSWNNEANILYIDQPNQVGALIIY
jgi:carboxypeptidase C (cathepsin A)